MNCTVCDHTNPEGARFCMNCGAPLTAAGSPTPVSDLQSRTPPHLTRKILADRTALNGERRTVTVLFADAVGSTPMEEKLDPEQTYRIIQGAVGVMMDCVHHCEGTITQFRGDGVMALFGAPIAHENAAHRGVAAALNMQRRLQDYAVDIDKEHDVDLRFRVGLNTGLVVVGTISDDLSMDYTAMGDTVNLAARMEASAHPGTVLISENTYEAVKDYVDCESLGPILVKGKSQPVPVYRALREKGIRSRLEVSATRGLTPFVGRSEDLARLQQSIERVKQGAGQVLYVSGEAGIGKSRLLLECRRSLSEDVTWLEGRCQPYGAAPAQPIADIVRGVFDIGDCDDERSVLDRLEAQTAGWSEERLASLPFLRYLLGVAPGHPRVAMVVPAERASRVRESVRTLLGEESSRHPLVVVVEDLHWLDENTNSVLLGLLPLVAAAPVLLVLTHRPGPPPMFFRSNILEAERALPARALGSPDFYQRLALDQLAGDEASALAARVLGAPVPAELQRLIAEKADGNPLFVEEIARSLLDSGMLERRNGNYALHERPEHVRIPDSLEEIILARIDRLHLEPRQTVQVASVIGREFSRPLLERVADPQAGLDAALSELEDLDFIYEAAYTPESAYAFKHAVTGEVAYSTLLRERRKLLHQTIAESMEALYVDHLPEHYEMLARHYHESEVWPKALEYLEKAGDKAFSIFGNTPAVDFYSKALAVCERMGDSALPRMASLLQKRADANFNLRRYQETLDDNSRWRALAVRLNDVAMEGLTLVNRGSCEHMHQTFESGLSVLEDALAFANEHNLGFVRLRALTTLVLAYYDCHRMSDARRALQSAIELADTVQPSDSAAVRETARSVTMVPPGTIAPMRFMLGLNGGMFLSWAGQYDEALALLDRYSEAAGSLPNIYARFNFFFTEGLALAGKGDYERALALLGETVVSCERLGEHFFQSRILNTIGWIHADLQDFERAIYWNERSLETARGWNPPAPDVEGNALVNLADAFIALGRLDEAEERLRQVAKMVEEKVPKDCMQQWRYTLHHFASFAELWLARGEWERAATAADECLELAQKTESAKYVARALRARGLAQLGQGNLAEAETEIDGSLAVARNVANPPQFWLTLEALGKVRAAQDRPTEARQAYAEAVAVIDGVAAGLSDARLRQSFLNSDHIRGIRAAAGR